MATGGQSTQFPTSTTTRTKVILIVLGVPVRRDRPRREAISIPGATADQPMAFANDAKSATDTLGV